MAIKGEVIYYQYKELNGTSLKTQQIPIIME